MNCLHLYVHAFSDQSMKTVSWHYVPCLTSDSWVISSIRGLLKPVSSSVLDFRVALSLVD